MNYRQIAQPNLNITEQAGWCLSFARRVFGAPAVEATAWEAWENTTHKHRDRNFPQGVSVPVWFDWWGDVGEGYKRYGHAAVLHTDGKVWSSPLSGTARAWFASIDDLIRAFGGGMVYVGWSEDISGVRVIEQEDIMDARMTDNVWLGLYGEHVPEAKKNQWVGKKMDDMITAERASAKWKARNRAAKGLMDDNGQIDAVVLTATGSHASATQIKAYKGKNWHKVLDELRDKGNTVWKQNMNIVKKLYPEALKATSGDFVEVTDKLYKKK